MKMRIGDNIFETKHDIKYGNDDDGFITAKIVHTDFYIDNIKVSEEEFKLKASNLMEGRDVQ